MKKILSLALATLLSFSVVAQTSKTLDVPLTVTLQTDGSVQVSIPAASLTLAPPAKPVASADKATVTTVGPVLTSADGTTWGINAAKQVVVNSGADLTTANVIELAYVSGKIWHENTAANWYSKTVPTDKWSAATPTNPLTGAAPPAASTKTTILQLFATLKANKQVLSGQHADIWNKPLSDSGVAPGTAMNVAMQNITALIAQSGQAPAIVGVVLNYATNSWAIDPSITEQMVAAQLKKGALVQLTLYSNIPYASGMAAPQGVSVDATTFHNAATAGTAEERNWSAFLTGTVWPEIKKLTAGGNTLLFRPFTELNGNWNWYAGQNASDFIALWRAMYASAQAAGVGPNLIWEYNINSGVGRYGDYYPGADVVDTVGFDNYDTAAKFGADIAMGNMWTTLKGLAKPVVLSEIGLIANNPNVTANTLNDADYLPLLAQVPEVVGMVNWCQGLSLSNQKNAKTFMTGAGIVNLGKLPAGVSLH